MDTAMASILLSNGSELSADEPVCLNVFESSASQTSLVAHAALQMRRSGLTDARSTFYGPQQQQAAFKAACYDETGERAFFRDTYVIKVQCALQSNTVARPLSASAKHCVSCYNSEMTSSRAIDPVDLLLMVRAWAAEPAFEPRALRLHLDRDAIQHCAPDWHWYIETHLSVVAAIADVLTGQQGPTETHRNLCALSGISFAAAAAAADTAAPPPTTPPRTPVAPMRHVPVSITSAPPESPFSIMTADGLLVETPVVQAWVASRRRLSPPPSPQGRPPSPPVKPQATAIETEPLATTDVAAQQVGAAASNRSQSQLGDDTSSNPSASHSVRQLHWGLSNDDDSQGLMGLLSGHNFDEPATPVVAAVTVAEPPTKALPRPLLPPPPKLPSTVPTVSSQTHEERLIAQVICVIVQYFCLLTNQADNAALAAVLDAPNRSLGDAALTALRHERDSQLAQNRFSLYQVAVTHARRSVLAHHQQQQQQQQQLTHTHPNSLHRFTAGLVSLVNDMDSLAVAVAEHTDSVKGLCAAAFRVGTILQRNVRLRTLEQRQTVSAAVRRVQTLIQSVPSSPATTDKKSPLRKRSMALHPVLDGLAIAPQLVFFTAPERVPPPAKSTEVATTAKQRKTKQPKKTQPPRQLPLKRHNDNTMASRTDAAQPPPTKRRPPAQPMRAPPQPAPQPQSKSARPPKAKAIKVRPPTQPAITNFFRK